MYRGASGTVGEADDVFEPAAGDPWLPPFAFAISLDISAAKSILIVVRCDILMWGPDYSGGGEKRREM